MPGKLRWSWAAVFVPPMELELVKAQEMAQQYGCFFALQDPRCFRMRVQLRSGPGGASPRLSLNSKTPREFKRWRVAFVGRGLAHASAEGLGMLARGDVQNRTSRTSPATRTSSHSSTPCRLRACSQGSMACADQVRAMSMHWQSVWFFKHGAIIRGPSHLHALGRAGGRGRAGAGVGRGVGGGGATKGAAMRGTQNTHGGPDGPPV
jgi:hypothetical protein